MRVRRWLIRPSYTAMVLVVILLTTTGVTLLHWHKDWADQGCQLCHVRHLPSLHSQIAVGYGSPLIYQQDLNCEHSGEELETCILGRSGRSPPSSISFTV